MEENTDHTRRSFLRRTMLMAAAAAAASFRNLPAMQDKIIARKIPTTGESLPVVGLGTWQQFDLGASREQLDQLREVLRQLHKHGGKMIDSSPMYGRAEQVVGDLTEDTGLANQFFYATKVWTSGRENGIRQMEDSLRKMQRKSMDLMQIHNLVDWRTHLQTLNEWKQQGKIRYCGITHYTDSSHKQLEQIIRTNKIDFVQVNYSIRQRNAEESLLPACRDRGVAVIVNQPFESGSLFSLVKGKELPVWVAPFGIRSWGQFFLKFILSHPAINCVIPGTSNPRHLIDNAEAGMGKMPDNKVRNQMAEYIRSL